MSIMFIANFLGLCRVWRLVRTEIIIIAIFLWRQAVRWLTFVRRIVGSWVAQWLASKVGIVVVDIFVIVLLHRQDFSSMYFSSIHVYDVCEYLCHEGSLSGITNTHMEGKSSHYMMVVH